MYTKEGVLIASCVQEVSLLARMGLVLKGCNADFIAGCG
jgi:hypothetical protein